MNEVTTKISKSGLKRFMALFLSLCLCLTTIQMNVWAAGETVESIRLSKEELFLKVGDTTDLTVTVATSGEGTQDPTLGEATQDPTTGEGTQISWKSSNEDVVAVEATEDATAVKVKAVGAGTATITVSVGGKSESCAVTVTDVVDPTTGEGQVSISLSNTTLAIEAGKTATIKVTKVAPEDATVAWSSSNEAVATVVNGVITAKTAGNTVITATATKGDETATATCNVTVTAAPTPTPTPKPPVVEKPAPDKVTLNTASATVPKGKTVALTATVTPANANNTSVTWTSSDDKIAAVNSTGVVTGKKAGQATITATTVNGKTATCKITVAEVTLNAKSTVIQVKKSSSAVKVATKYPANDKVASYVSSNTKIATVNKKTGKVTGKKVGSTTITVTMKSGATATFKVKVQKGKVVTKSLKFAAKNVSVVKGKKTTLSVTRNPISATEKLTYTSSNKKVATVDKKGKVTGKAYGTAKITVKSSNGKKTTCTVKVVPKVTLKKTKASIAVNGTTTIAVKSLIKGDKVKSYKSADTKIATVNKKGKVTGKKAGTTTITVTTKKGGTATFTVTVK